MTASVWEITGTNNETRKKKEKRKKERQKEKLAHAKNDRRPDRQHSTNRPQNDAHQRSLALDASSSSSDEPTAAAGSGWEIVEKKKKQEKNKKKDSDTRGKGRPVQVLDAAAQKGGDGCAADRAGRRGPGVKAKRSARRQMRSVAAGGGGRPGGGVRSLTSSS